MWLLTSVNNLLPWRTRHDRQTRGGNLQLWPSSSRARTQQQTEISNNGECGSATDFRYKIPTSFLCCSIGDCKKELLTSCFSKRQSFQNICFPPLVTKEEILFSNLLMWWVDAEFTANCCVAVVPILGDCDQWERRVDWLWRVAGDCLNCVEWWTTLAN